MTGQRKTSSAGTLLMAALTLAACVLFAAGSAWGAVQYLDDGALQNAAGGWNLPAQGTCPADPTKVTRPDCLALRIVAADSTACTAANGSWSTAVCNDLVNSTQVSCQAQVDRLWNPGTSTCAIVMLGDDRNNVVCSLHGGTWVTYTAPAGTCVGSWVMPARTAYTPNLLTGTGPGDQCLRCHNTVTEYNGPRVRDTEDTLYMGHKNMARKVTPGSGLPWGGPPFTCSIPIYLTEEDCIQNGGSYDPTIYPSDDSGNVFNWALGQITIGANARDLTWIYGDWLSALPRAVYKAPAATTANTCSDPRPGLCSLPAYISEGTCLANGGTWRTNSCTVVGGTTNCALNGFTCLNGAGASYSCGRCHTTGWTSDATINTATTIEGKEPELSFPNLTWDRNSNAPANVVSLSGGVSGDANKYSSWDVYGISCTRCHNSAIDTLNPVAGSSPTQYNAPAGMSSHHNVMTAPDVSSGQGYCSDPRFTASAQAQCDAAGAAWLTACSIAGVCSDPTKTTSGTCVAPATWTKYDTQALCLGAGGTWYGIGCVGDAALTTQVACQGAGKVWFAPGCTDPAQTTQANCEAAGQVWSDPRCDVPGVCNKGTCSDPLYANAVDCRDNGKTWTGLSTAAACAAASGQWIPTTDIIRCDDAGGRWTGSKTNRGQIITALCMNCHRQESGGVPYMDTAALAGDNNQHPGQYLKVGPAHGTIAFVSHPHGNQFLNSPHGKFSGKFNEIATGKFNFAMTGEYTSFFMTEGEAANTGNGCTGCHDVHTSTVTGEEPFREECTECHAKNLGTILHPGGGGTPLENIATEPMEACEICHMPEGLHLFRINPEESYSTFPMPAALTATVNANTSPDGTFTNAVWVDVDHACGQCHGGGTGQLPGPTHTTTGSINVTTPPASNPKTLTVADATGFVVGDRVSIAGAGALYYDDEGQGFNSDFETYIVSVVGNVITLAGNATKSVTDAVVEQNPTRNNAAYLNKTKLARYAKNIHNDRPQVSFGYALTPNSWAVNFFASANCGGPCDLYEWDFGDGDTGSGAFASHTYAAAGTYVVTLTVERFGVNSASTTRNVTVYPKDDAPTAEGLDCTVNPDWSVGFQDTSSDDTALVTVKWGDGSLLSTGGQGSIFTHTYKGPGKYNVVHKAVDNIGQQSTDTCVANVFYFTISGTVTATDNTVAPPVTGPVASARVTVQSGSTVRTAYTSTTGTYSVGKLKPGTYSVTVTKAGHTFHLCEDGITSCTDDANCIGTGVGGETCVKPSATVGPNSAGNDVAGTKP